MSVRVSAPATQTHGDAERIDRLVAGRAASKLAEKDHTLWGEAAGPEAAIRLGWVADPREMLPLIDEVQALRARFAEHGVDHFVLCGMGGSSLAPEVMAAWAGVPLEILDSTHPDQVAQALSAPLERTAVIVSSKSGTTVETATTRAAFAHAFRDSGIDPTERIIIVTDPDSPLHHEAEGLGHRVFLADPQVGGRFSALTAFGLVPAGLAGVDTRVIIEQAHEAWAGLREDSADNPAVVLAAALSAPGRDIAVLTPSPQLPGLGDWVEQLVAESTGKEGVGVLPVVTHDPTPAEAHHAGKDVLLVDLSGTARAGQLSIEATLGGSFLLWEYATALTGILLEINPFDQPDVESAKTAARGLLEKMPTRPAADAQTADYQLWASQPVASFEQAWQQLRESLSDSGYLSLQVYGNRLALGNLVGSREQLASGLGRPVTLGFGPRFLHSTGQFHKGGRPDGVFVQIEVEPQLDVDIPGFPYSFGTLIDAQSWGDRQVLIERGRPVLTIRVADQAALSDIVAQLLEWV